MKTRTSAIVLLFIALPASATDYYMDAINGSNANPGTAASPWKNVDRVNTISFQAGDTVRFPCGQQWRGAYLQILAATGTETQPVVVGGFPDATCTKENYPTISGSGPLDHEPMMNMDLDISQPSATPGLDDFPGWGELQGGSSNTLTASTDTANGVGRSARLYYAGGPRPALLHKPPLAIAAAMPVVYSYRVKVVNGGLEVRIRNLASARYYDGTNWVSSVTAVRTETASTWTQVTIPLTTDTVLGQLQIEFIPTSFVGAIALVDDLVLSTQWMADQATLYKRAMVPRNVGGPSTTFLNGVPTQKFSSLAALLSAGVDGDWYWDTAQRLYYLRYSAGDPAAAALEVDRVSGALVSATGDFITVQHMVLENAGNAVVACTDVVNCTVFSSTVNDLQVKGNVIRNMTRKAVLVGNTGLAFPFYRAKIINNEISTSKVGIYLARVHDSVVSGNILADIGYYGDDPDNEPIGLQVGSGNTFEHNQIQRAIQGIGIWGDHTNPAFDNVIQYNVIHDIDYAGILMGGTQDDHDGVIRGHVYNSVVAYNVVYNSGFGNPNGGGIRQNNTPAGAPNRYFNNVLHGNFYNFSGAADFAGNFIYRNNISISPVMRHLEFAGTDGSFRNDLASSELSHNLYFPDGGVGSGLFNWHGVYDTFSQYVTGSQGDSNSLAADPLLTNIASNDFRPTANSPAIDAGTPVGLTADIAGTPVGASPDIGAYEYPGAELSVSVGDAPDPVNTDSPLSYTISVANIGVSDATGVTVTHALPTGVTGSGVASQGNCTGTDVINCTLGTIPNGQNATVTVTAVPGAEALFDATPNTTFVVNVSAATTVTAPEIDPIMVMTATDIRLACLGQPVTKRGTGSNDGTSSKRFAGGSGGDVIHTLSGADWIDGKGGNDTICGGAGNDNLNGSGGADVLSGGPGTDTCNGGSGTDSTDGSCETVNSVP